MVLASHSAGGPRNRAPGPLHAIEATRGNSGHDVPGSVGLDDPGPAQSTCEPALIDRGRDRGLTDSGEYQDVVAGSAARSASRACRPSVSMSTQVKHSIDTCPV